MFQEDSLSPRRKQKRLAFKTARRSRLSGLDEEVKPDLAHARQSQPRPATKRTLHHLIKYWQSVGDEYLEILATESESQWDMRVLKSR